MPSSIQQPVSPDAARGVLLNANVTISHLCFKPFLVSTQPVAALPFLTMTPGKTVFSWVTHAPGGTQVMFNSQHDGINATFPRTQEFKPQWNWDDWCVMMITGVDTLISLNLTKSEKKPFSSCCLPLGCLKLIPVDDTWLLSGVTWYLPFSQAVFSPEHTTLQQCQPASSP